MPSSNQDQTKAEIQAKRNEFMGLLSDYVMQEIAYHMADAAKATDIKDRFSWKRNAAYKAILDFVFPAKEETETGATPADQHPTESPTPAPWVSCLKELKLARETFNIFGSIHSSQKDFKNAQSCFNLANQMERGIEALEMLIHQHGNYKFAFEQWHEKTQWVQDTCESHELGKHRADVLKDRIDSLIQQLKTSECKCKCNHVPFNVWFTEELAKKSSKGTNT